MQNFKQYSKYKVKASGQSKTFGLLNCPALIGVLPKVQVVKKVEYKRAFPTRNYESCIF